ncbi:hypothetical protein KUTeg_001177 [Tegillarca granosa]|uniref:Ankyrin repeat-containing protein n=1 Tax=Tegillarca granosa TaxID=220873 RepID=A0ABQ9FVP6_TEGGR|nr:hypothetical protein KUTeg_001177 [Tegillarca granosa]
MRKNNIRNVILHPSINDERFRNTFFHELKKEENRNIIENQNVNENSLFMLSCLFNKFPMVLFLLEHSNIPQASISEGFKLSLTLDNCETFNLLLPFLSQQEIEEKFISCCLTGEEELVKSFIRNQNKISNEVFKNGFRILCIKGRTELVQFVLFQCPVTNELIKYGFSAACQHEAASTAKVLLNAAIDLSDDDIKQWLICLSTTLVGLPLLEKLFFTYPTISKKIVSTIFRNLCLKGNISGLNWLLKQECLSDKTIVEVLTTIVKTKGTELKNDSIIYTTRLEVNSEGVKCRSKSMGCYKSKPNLSKEKICRQRSISDSTNVTEPSHDSNQAHINLDDNFISPTFSNDAPIEDVTKLTLSKRKSITTNDLRDFIMKIFENGHKDCFMSVLNERPCVPENYILDGIKLAFIGHHVDIIKVVLQRGTLSPATINTVLTYACDKENTVIVGYILKRLDISQSTVIEKLEKAVREKNVKTVEVILQMEMYLPERVLTHLLTYLCKTGDHIILKVILSYRRNDIPSRIIRQCFLRACYDGFVNIIDQLLIQVDNLEKQTIFQGLHAACKFNKVDVVEILFSRGVIFPKTILKESLIVACLNYSLETIEMIGRCTSLSERLVNQIGIICLHVRPSLFASVIKIYKKDVPSLTCVGSLYDSTLTTILRDIRDSFSTSEQTDSSRKFLYILAVYGDKTTISTVYQNAFYMSHWMVSEILKNACKENRHKIVQTILDLANDIPFDILHQGLVQAFEHHSVESIRCILNSRQDVPEWCLEGSFVAACRNSSAEMVTTVLVCRRELRTEFIEKGVTVAVVNKNYEIAKILLKERIDILSRCFVDLFKEACVNCDRSIVALLLKFERYIEISIVIRCFLESCVLNLKSNVEMILQLSTVPCSVLLQGFNAACRWNNIDICCKILDQYPNLDTREIKNQLYILCLIGKAKAILPIVSNRQDLTVFVFLKCCELGRLKIVKSILKGKTLNQENISLGITAAIRNIHQKILKYILVTSFVQVDSIALHLKEACKNGKLDLVECVLYNCHDISIPIIDKCFSLACENRHVKIVKALLYHTSDKMVVKDAILSACRKMDFDVLDAILENVSLSDKVQTQVLQEAFSIASSNLILIILIKCQQLTPKNIHDGIAWLDANNKETITNLTMQVCDKINTKYLVSVMKYACSQSSIRVIKIILSSTCVFTQENLREILMEACSKNNPAAFEAILKLQPQLAVKHLFQILLRTVEYRNVLILNTLLKCRRDLFIKNESLSGKKQLYQATMKS